MIAKITIIGSPRIYLVVKRQFRFRIFSIKLWFFSDANFNIKMNIDSSEENSILYELLVHAFRMDK